MSVGLGINNLYYSNENKLIKPKKGVQNDF